MIMEITAAKNKKTHRILVMIGMCNQNWYIFNKNQFLFSSDVS